MREIQVEFHLYEQEEAALQELLPFYHQYQNKSGERPFAHWTIDKLFCSLMQTGSIHDIRDKIKYEQFRQGFITIDEYVDKDKEFLTIADRQKTKEPKESITDKLASNKEIIESKDNKSKVGHQQEKDNREVR